jgi:FtsP/CotA-like multicopper oxidase with cupredoxin domain
MPALTRRGILAAAGGAAVLTAMSRPRSGAAPVPADIAAQARTIEVNGKPARVLGLVQPNGSHGLALMAGDRFEVTLSNDLPEPTVVHWHGLTPPAAQDGVAHLSQDPIPPGRSHAYSFENGRTGTHWMHSHLGLQEQLLLAAPLIVRSREDPARDEPDHVVMVHDFTFRDPAEILAELKAGGGGHDGHHGMDHSNMVMGAKPAMLNDVAFDAYLANDRTLADPEIVRAEKGGTLRLRIINAAAASNMWIDLGALRGELIAVDGNAIEPVGGNVFPLAIAQRADIRITVPKEGGAWPVLFRPEGVIAQTGIVLATPGWRIGKIATEAVAPAPAVNLAQEARLRAALPLAEAQDVQREMLHLGGGGADYVWTLNGQATAHATVLTVRPNRRIELAMTNMTAMAHPMHLHGHHFQIVGIGSTRLKGAMRDTVLVPPMETVTIAFDTDNPGRWALHCHHLYHMNSGMMGTMAYEGAA